jgi:hypothetical protein
MNITESKGTKKKDHLREKEKSSSTEMQTVYNLILSDLALANPFSLLCIH